MKIVFFGSGEFAAPALRAVAAHVALVVTQPDRPSGRGLRPQASSVRRVAEELGLPVATPERAGAEELLRWVKDLAPDLLLVAAYGQILKPDLLAIAKQGGVNLHGSILPAYRGAAPIQRAILAGETETGVTLMQMDEGMDTGDVIHTGRLPIGPDETYGELQTRLAEMAGELARAWLPKLAAGGYLRTPQRGDLASLALKVHKSEAELSFDRAARSEYNRFRAFTPSPGAFLRIAGSATRISRARFAEAGGKPGDMIAGGEGCLVVFKDGSIDLLEVQPEGKKRMSGRDLANGWRLRPGASLR